MRMTRNTWLGLLLAGAAVSAGCEQTPFGNSEPRALTYAAVDTTFSINTNRQFNQVERLGNPLAMEVFVDKREHGAHDVMPPTRDPGHFTDDYVRFITTVAKRDEAYARTIAGALLGTFANPGDKIAVYPNRAAGVTASTANTASNTNTGYLTHVLAPGVGYGGRKLAGDDVVDKSLAVLFGSALGNMNNVSPALVTDNVANQNPAPMSTFPYLPAN